MNIIEKLDQLADFRSQKDLITLQEDEAHKAVVPAEVQKLIDEIDVEFQGRREIVSEKIDVLVKEIKTDVLEHGVTVKGAHLKAVWNKGRVSWNTKALEGYAVAHPEVAAFRKEGNPSITIRK